MLLDEHLVTENSLILESRKAIKRQFIKELEYLLLVSVIAAIILVFTLRAEWFIWYGLGILVAIAETLLVLVVLVDFRRLRQDYGKDGLVKQRDVFLKFIEKNETNNHHHYIECEERGKIEISEYLYFDFPKGTEVYLIRGRYSKKIWNIEKKEKTNS